MNFQFTIRELRFTIHEKDQIPHPQEARIRDDREGKGERVTKGQKTQAAGVRLQATGRAVEPRGVRRET